MTTTTNPWLGLKPPEGTEYSSLVGAQAIHDIDRADFVGDCWSFEGKVLEDGDKDLMDWISNKARPWIQKMVEKAEFRDFHRDQSPYHAIVKINPVYVRCCFWKAKEWKFNATKDVRSFLKLHWPDLQFRVSSGEVADEQTRTLKQVFIVTLKDPNYLEYVTNALAGSNAYAYLKA